ncbi:protein GLUTAMINE DUMPER 6-like [Prosopis cineraria]|uniref:protein GLUTAMINE DUMPER 6-like n=1 Tax=Prosopis cineraria TaxID=364024 RepID=UPI002410524A|nr:protein GLUTAMINE DUMPER 6-like [Prosopis cineraria]
MRPVMNNNNISVWRSPVPYLFGGLGLVLALMSLALIILFCSHRKRPSSSSPLSSSSSSPEEDSFRSLQVMAMADSEPKILVIMAGDDKPTYLAQPIVPLSYCTCEPEPEASSSSTSMICSSNSTDQKINH